MDPPRGLMPEGGEECKVEKGVVCVYNKNKHPLIGLVRTLIIHYFIGKDKLKSIMNSMIDQRRRRLG